MDYLIIIIVIRFKLMDFGVLMNYLILYLYKELNLLIVYKLL